MIKDPETNESKAHEQAEAPKFETQEDVGFDHEKKEHGLSDAVTEKLVNDHLKENPNYYTMLKKLEGKTKKGRILG